jgi:hypothetical protein
LENFLQVFLASLLAAEIGGAVIFYNVGIGRGIPFTVIHAVENSTQIAFPGAEDAFEPAAVFRSQDLPGVSPAHRRKRVGKENSAFEKIDAPVEFKIFRRQIARVEIQEMRRRHGKISLEREIMDREDGPALSLFGPGSRVEFFERRKGRRLPVVAMDHVPRTRAPGQVERGLGEKREPRRVVRIIPPRRAVKLRPAKEAILPYQINRDAVVQSCF